MAVDAARRAPARDTVGLAPRDAAGLDGHVHTLLERFRAIDVAQPIRATCSADTSAIGLTLGPAGPRSPSLTQWAVSWALWGRVSSPPRPTQRPRC